MVATAGLSLTLDPKGKMIQNATLITIFVKEHIGRSQFMPSRITYHHFCQGTHVTIYVKDYISPFFMSRKLHIRT